ncbi:hypothetical protein LI078_02420 [Stenotrophomonas maltophilia]|uniref:hypothetical protein n=1 Tax=Stenotrophomonas geniculata TaxID=86188 RepID=UPI001D065E10|nr:hypothetical protein [Stenotrophomonas geniculata]MCB7145419.1 hypothetical protein [Stenotrophomonas maltophilia]MCI1073483.1 hypothetical protein [Stenotrophomonas maltophilia]MCI1085862.1 hypothetical protein [Stenotrophomonas maltophilia]MCI1114909.1 hypothetical protein [Stenotrophomonas maltophilia]
MADMKRLHRGLWVSFALLALAACAPERDPTQTVERDAGTEAVPARSVGDAMQMQPAQPVEGEAAPEAMGLRRADEGGVDIRKVDVAAGQGADTPASPAEAKH